MPKIKTILLTFPSIFKTPDLVLESFLESLSSFAKSSKISIFLITGLYEEVGQALISKHKLDRFIPLKNIFHVNEEYLSSLSEIDKEIRAKKYLSSKEYIDEFFKIYFLTTIKPKLNDSKTLLIGKDVWLDAYYLVEYTKANILLLKPNITFNKAPYEGDLKTIFSLSPNFEELKGFLETNHSFDYTKLKSFAKNYLMNQTIGKLNLNIDYEKLYKNKKE